MNPIYNEYLEFLKHNGIDIDKHDLKEGYYWLDNQIIKAYDKQGNLHKVLRLKINDDLTIVSKEYEKNTYEKSFEIETWLETAERKKNNLLELEKESLDIIRGCLDKYNSRLNKAKGIKEYAPIVLTSTGKDSQVLMYLVDQIIKARKIFNNTSLDCADTYRFVKTIKDVEIINPKEGYYQWRERYNIVNTRANRGCCKIFKETAVFDSLDKKDKFIIFLGMRREESSKRANYAEEWNNDNWGLRKWQGVLPIVNWSEEDIWLFTFLKGIAINPKYFKGYSRVGCAVVCPNYSKTTWILDKHFYPTLYNRFHKILEKDFIENKKACIMNCSLSEYHIGFCGGMVHKEPSEEVIIEFANQQDLDIETARKYFNKNCCDCKKKLKKDDIGLSMKYYGTQTKDFKCLDCIAKELNIKPQELKEKIKEFKDTGCVLF